MQALRRTGTHVKLTEREVPVCRPGEALIRVRMAGICNTDLEIARGYMSFEGTLGHEFVGEVVDVAAEGAKDWLGRRVAGEINLACHRCDLCRRNLPRHCQNRTVLGIAGKDGAFAEYLTLPLENLHQVPDALSDRAACFVEPLAACYEILEQVSIEQGTRVAVLGDGKLGQLTARVLQACGLTPVLVGKHDDKLARASQRGVQTAKATDLAANSCDLVIEATGNATGMHLALHLLRPRGTLVLKSTYHGALTLDAAPIVIDEITVIGSRCGPFPPALQALSKHSIDPESMIDAVFPLADAERALEVAARPALLKVLVQMPEA
jgi:threonine dehydrogenase-like Zn-dependent dehydrogenase